MTPSIDFAHSITGFDEIAKRRRQLKGLGGFHQLSLLNRDLEGFMRVSENFKPVSLSVMLKIIHHSHQWSSGAGGLGQGQLYFFK